MQTDADFEPRCYEVRHRTVYSYEGTVETCYERGFLAPRSTPSQTVLSNRIEVEPRPDVMQEHVDFFGNHSFYVEVRTPHERLEVTKTSVVEVETAKPDLERLDNWTVATAAQAVATSADPVERATYLLPSTLVGFSDSVSAYGGTHLSVDMPLGQALLSLVHGIYGDFEYRPGATTVKTTLPELLQQRAGVCQDFTHLALGVLRSLGLPARYVSGYLETSPPPGKPKLEGSDASHAWPSVLLPDGTWLDIDPTNSQLCDSRYVVTAWGRDFRDVSPLKGVIFTEAKKSSLTVGVDVTRLGT